MQQTGGHGQVAHIAFKEHLSAITRMQKSSFLQLYPLLTHSKPAKVSHFIMPGLSVAIACPFSRTPQSIKTFYHMVQPQFYKIHCSYPHTKNNKKKFKKIPFSVFRQCRKNPLCVRFQKGSQTMDTQKTLLIPPEHPLFILTIKHECMVQHRLQLQTL